MPEFKELLPHVPILIVSGALEVQQQINALQGPRRAHYCITKPVDFDQFAQVVKQIDTFFFRVMTLPPNGS